MKTLRLITLWFSIFVLVLNSACKKEESCPEGYIGDNCEIFDPTNVQILLNLGESPKTLFDAGIPIDSLYGKIYKDGLLFYLNVNDDTGMVAAIEDQSRTARWGCQQIDIPNLNNIINCPGNENCVQPVPDETEEGTLAGDGKSNTEKILASCAGVGIAAKVCTELGTEWFLPSRGELNLIYLNLYSKGHGDFSGGGGYWSSTEVDSLRAWFQIFNDGFHYDSGYKNLTGYTRAVKTF